MSDPTTPDGAGGAAEMTLERLRSILDAYGASPDRWPPEERTAAVLLLDRSEDARLAHAEAMHLDIALDHANAPGPAPDLVARLYRRGTARQGLSARIAAMLPGWLSGGTRAPWMRPAAFALTMALGIVIGLAIPRGGDPGADRPQTARPAVGVVAAFEPDTATDDGDEDGAAVLILLDLDSGSREDFDSGDAEGSETETRPLDDIPLI